MLGVIVIDIDDDLGKKAKIPGPVIGLENCKAAAYQLLLADPEDPDGNTIFKAIQIYEDLEEKNKNIIILTGDSRMGYYAYKKINESLDLIINKYGLDSAILVTDGLSDENDVIPILGSRKIKIIQIVRLNIKQSSKIENAYMFIVNKLKDPYYSRLIFGIPGLLLFFISSMILLNIPTSTILFIIGFIMIMYGFNIHQRVYDLLNIFEIRKYNFIIIGAGIIIASISGVVGYELYIRLINSGEEWLYSLFRGIELAIYPIILYLALLYGLNAVFGDSYLKRLNSAKAFLILGFILINLIIGINFITGTIFLIRFDTVILYSIISTVLTIMIMNYIDNLKMVYIYLSNPIGYRVIDSESRINFGTIKRLDEDRIIVETDYKETLDLKYDNVINIKDRTVYVKS
ncbi:MAG: DUF373 family protein [Candidatus Anstonellales archaeon]